MMVSPVLILVVMDDALALDKVLKFYHDSVVLILVVMDDALALGQNLLYKRGTRQS